MLVPTRLAASSTIRSALLIFALGLLPLAACTPTSGSTGTSEDAGTNTGDNDGGPSGDSPCPAGNGGGFSVCQIQHPDEPSRPAVENEVTVRGVVALTNVYDINSDGSIKGIFVADVPLKEFGGILVTFTADDGFTANAGDLVDVTGTFKAFSSGAAGAEERIEASFFQATGGTADITPLAVSDPAVLADESLGEPYEGLLVRINDVTVTNPSVGFGQWEVTGGLITDDTIYRYTPLEGEVLSTLVGVMGYNAFADGGFRLLPRSGDDLVSASRPSATIPQLLDPAHADYIEGCPFCPGTTQTCTVENVYLEGMVVVSETYFITMSSSRGPQYGFFIADPSAVDAEGRLLPYSGILATINPEWSGVGENDYVFSGEFDGDFFQGFAADAVVPQIGDRISITGENGGFCGQPQIGGTSSLKKLGTVPTAEMPKPALFDGTLADVDDQKHPANLKGGRPAVTEAGFEREAIAADPDIGKWLGVLVELQNVNTTSACVDSFTTSQGTPRYQDFGYWQVTGDAEIGTLFDRTFGGYWSGVQSTGPRTCEDAATTGKCDDSRAVDQLFESLTGIVNFSFDVYRVNPRSTDDIQPQSLFVAEGTGTCVAP